MVTSSGLEPFRNSNRTTLSLAPCAAKCNGVKSFCQEKCTETYEIELRIQMLKHLS